MNLLPKDELQTLIQPPEGLCISIFMPTYRAGIETQQNSIRLKNLLTEAQETLLANGLRLPEAQKLLDPVRALEDDGLFWQRQSDGLAIFVAPGVFHYYCLPIKFEELVVVNEQFHLKPLLPLFSGDGRFYILALSQKAVRLLQGTRYSINEVDLPDMPTSLAEALQYDDPEKQLQFHTGTAPGPGQQGAIFHSQGVGQDDEKENLRRYLRQVADGIQKLLKDEHVPLVLAGTTPLLGIYREVNDYSYLIKEGVTGNPEPLSNQTLHQQAWKIVEPYLLEAQQEAKTQYRQLAQTKRASQDIREIVPAAHYGRIDTLFVAIDDYKWGAFDPQNNTLELRSQPKPGDGDLLDRAAVQTLLKGGVVYALPSEQMPEEAPLAAVFRYW